ncbi:uncharacterized protein LOC134253749 [Saccostrea cucullata]|uniref:uncharacterized protein LOC134253749 n=1 Tax=Saccostrea cuccullata TaxID=36930 RepID=UPI002ED475EF
MIDSYRKYSIVDCVKECLRTRRCKSVNYYKGANYCEINFEGNTSGSGMNRQSSGWIYTAIENWDKGLIGSCLASACAINEKCIRSQSRISKCVMSDCGIPTKNNTTWDVQDGDGIGIFKEMHLKCLDSFQQRGSGRILCLENGTWKSDLLCQDATDCKSLYDNGNTNSGVYEVYPYSTSSRPVRVFCDMGTLHGGWTVIQKRVDGVVSFDRVWSEYKHGFGEPEGNHWIGNDVIHQLTKGRNSSLYVSITLVSGSRLYALYDRFSVSTEADKYKLFLEGYLEGTLGDSMVDTGYAGKDLSGVYFSTPDRDYDRFLRGSCAGICKGGWWFNNCYKVFLNGPLVPRILDRSMVSCSNARGLCQGDNHDGQKSLG